MIFGAIAFWVNDAKSAWFIYQKMVFLFGGMLIPLQFLPGTLRTTCSILPFSAMAYVPGRIVGTGGDQFLIVVQLVWYVAFLGLGMWLYAAGERRIVAGRA